LQPAAGMRTRLSLLAALAALVALPATAGATWSQATIPSSDGVKLHADVLRPKNLAADAKTPVIVSIGPYFNHSGQTGPAGPAEGTSYDPVGPSTGPSDRCTDFVDGAHLMHRGYTYVMVDLRGFGGSTGCLDWGGPGEQSDVVAAVQWAAAQPWSTGKVGMYGKSSDAVTGLIGVDKQPAGLKAVVAQEPVYDLYRYLYGDGIRRENSLATPALYDLIDATPGPAADDPTYSANGADDTAQYLQNHSGYERVWLGPWEHVRGNERDETGRLKMGRAGWFDEVMRFYDQFLKGEAPTVNDPPIAVQTNDGKWRAESQWPPADAKAYTTRLRTGAYTDDGTANATGDGAEKGVWTISKPLAHAVHLSGSGSATVDVSTSLPNANLVLDVYDLDASGTGPLITRQGHLLRSSGPVTLDLWSADWKIPAGHRIGVKVADANGDWWVHVPTKQTVTIESGSIKLPFLPAARPTGTIQGDPGTQLASYLAQTVSVPQGTIDASESAVATP
jgi:uncharacterized protein